MMGYSDFETKILKRNGGKKFKISNSWGIEDAFHAIRKSGGFKGKADVTESEFRQIVREVNKELGKLLSDGKEVRLPCGMGKLELRKYKGSPKIVNGKLKVNYPVDWHRTIELWYSDEEAKKNKTLVRFDRGYVYYIKYSKFGANYTNQCYYKFAINRFIKTALKENILKGKVDALW